MEDAHSLKVLKIFKDNQLLVDESTDPNALLSTIGVPLVGTIRAELGKWTNAVPASKEEYQGATPIAVVASIFHDALVGGKQQPGLGFVNLLESASTVPGFAPSLRGNLQIDFLIFSFDCLENTNKTIPISAVSDSGFLLLYKRRNGKQAAPVYALEVRKLHRGIASDETVTTHRDGCRTAGGSACLCVHGMAMVPSATWSGTWQSMTAWSMWGRSCTGPRTPW